MESFRVSESMPACHSMLNQREGNAFRDLRDVKVYPSVGMKRPHAHLGVNFGQKPFMFDIDRMVSVRTTSVLPWWARHSPVVARETKHYRRGQRRRCIESASDAE